MSEEAINLLAEMQYNVNQFLGVFLKGGVAIATEQYQNKVLHSITKPDYFSSKTKGLGSIKTGFLFQVNNYTQLLVNYAHIFGDDQRYISQAFGQIDPSINEVLVSVASVNTVTVGINFALDSSKRFVS